MRVFLALILGLVLAGCAAPVSRSGGDILVIGDSVMVWNRSDGADVGAALAGELRRDVVNRARLGAQVRPGGLASLGGLSIPAQLAPGRWNWIVMNGGANDLGFGCGCTRCDAEIDLLLAPDGSGGAILDLIGAARATGAQVLWLGYYQAPQSGSFRGCRPGLVKLERRIAAYARTQPGVFFIDAEDVMEPADEALLASDRTHPSPLGSAVIGRALAEAIRRAPPGG
jgi:lysophospholipase L1-like esterase